MGIIDELRTKIFESKSDFLERLAVAPYEDTFLHLLAEDMRTKLPNYCMAISVRFKQIVSPHFRKPEEALGIQRSKIRERICWSTWLDRDCKSEKCFDGGFLLGNEIDAMIVRNGQEFCFLEYERSRSELCDDFMKMYWLRQLFNAPFESLFVTLLTTRKTDGTFDEFSKYVTRVKPVLNCLLGNWGIMQIVDLNYREPKLNWEYSEKGAWQASS
jgi:hypothetical protein